MDSIKLSNILIVLLAVFLILVTGISLFTTMTRIERVPQFSYGDSVIQAKPYFICEGTSELTYPLELTINNIGYTVDVVKTLYNRETGRSLVRLNDADINESLYVQRNSINIAYEQQVTNGPVSFMQPDKIPDELAIGEYALFAVASVDDKISRYYAVEFEVISCVAPN